MAKIELQAESAGLVIVDMQVEGCERHGSGVKPMIANIRRLLDRFRAANGKIIHVQSVRTKEHPEFTVFGRVGPAFRILQSGRNICRRLAFLCRWRQE